LYFSVICLFGDRMSSPGADGVAQLARRLDLLTEDQLHEAFDEIGTRSAPAEEFLKFVERKGYLTPWQAAKLRKGDTEGYILGGYRILYRIAAGSFGRVYRADNPRTGEVVAIKVLRKRWGEDKRKIELFEREGKVGLQMQHNNIVRILAVNRDPITGQYYIVMEFVEGGNLRDFLGIRKKLGAEEALRLLEETAQGLAHAFTLGLTHRDMKPTNILISATKTAKLVDFGLAELAGGAREEGEEIDRTVDYAGLEKATNVKAGDHRSDIYFLGCTFYEMLTGRPLLTASREAKARMQRHRFELASQIKRDDPDIPPLLFSLLSRMVAFNPVERFQNYEQLVDAIQQARAEQGGGKMIDPTAGGIKTVYVIEGNEKLQDIFREKLKEKGYRVLLSINASQALSRFQQQPYHALIVDCGTTERDGLTVFQKVMRESEMKRIACAGILILNEDQAHWTEEVENSTRVKALVRPVTMRQIFDTLAEFVPV
jgi:serine/threonine protein kinase